MAKLAEAEALLLEGNSGLHKATLNLTDLKYRRDALARLARFYQATRQSEKAGIWQEKVTDFDKWQSKLEPFSVSGKATLPPQVTASGPEDALKSAEDALSEIRKVNGDSDKATLSAMKKLADEYGAAGRADLAIPLLVEISIHDPSENTRKLTLGGLQVFLGKHEDYLNTCRRAIAYAETTSNAGTAEHAAKIWCASPRADPALKEQALALIRRALATDNKLRAWRHLTLGMVEFRSGNYPAALEAMTIAEQARGTDRHASRIQSTVWLFRAMILLRQDKKEDSLALFEQAEAQMPPVPADKRLALNNAADCADLYLWLAYEEAKAMLKPEAQ